MKSGRKPRRKMRISRDERTAAALEAKAASRGMTVEAFIAEQLDLAEGN